MNFFRWSILFLATASFGIVGCEPAADSGDAGSDSTAAVDGSTDTMTVAVLCGKCGEEKGADNCCAADAETCACGLHKGTPLCCAELGDAAGQDICSGCGQVAATDHACADDAEVCEGCGLHKGAPACCKLKS